MTENTQIYIEQGKVYQSDTCQPLIKAWKAGKVQLEAWARLGYPGRRLEEGELPFINTIGYWDAHFQQDWGLDWHRNEGIEITFLETGSMPFSLEKDHYTLSPDQLTITRPWQPHKVGDPTVGKGRLYWFILDVEVRHPHQEWKWPPWVLLSKRDREELTRFLRQNEQPVWKVTPDIRKCFQRIGQLIVQGEPPNDSWIFIYINEILMHLLNLFRRGPLHLNESLTNVSRTVELFIKDLNESFFEGWILESMAAHCGLGVTRFVHYFKQLTNSTPMQYLISVRLETAAKYLIEKPDMTVNDICYDCGFSSSQYFSTIFHKQFGCSPTEYRSKRGSLKRVN